MTLKKFICTGSVIAFTALIVTIQCCKSTKKTLTVLPQDTLWRINDTTLEILKLQGFHPEIINRVENLKGTTFRKDSNSYDIKISEMLQKQELNVYKRYISEAILNPQSIDAIRKSRQNLPDSIFAQTGDTVTLEEGQTVFVDNISINYTKATPVYIKKNDFRTISNSIAYKDFVEVTLQNKTKIKFPRKQGECVATSGDYIAQYKNVEWHLDSSTVFIYDKSNLLLTRKLSYNPFVVMAKNGTFITFGTTERNSSEETLMVMYNIKGEKLLEQTINNPYKWKTFVYEPFISDNGKYFGYLTYFNEITGIQNQLFEVFDNKGNTIISQKITNTFVPAVFDFDFFEGKYFIYSTRENIILMDIETRKVLWKMKTKKNAPIFYKYIKNFEMILIHEFTRGYNIYNRKTSIHKLLTGQKVVTIDEGNSRPLNYKHFLELSDDKILMHYENKTKIYQISKK